MWLIKAFLKTYAYFSLDELIEDWNPVIGPIASFYLKCKDANNFKVGVTYRYLCDNGGHILIAKMENNKEK